MSELILFVPDFMTPLENLIHSEIKTSGPMNFARFMQLALYHPEWGYYSKSDSCKKIGRSGDFFTNVSVGPLFGKLLAYQLIQWWKQLEAPSVFHIVEAGGADGQLARDLLTSIRDQCLPCFEAVRYVFVEPLASLMRYQQAALSDFQCVSWVNSMNQLHQLQGIIFGNELLDAIPFHRLEYKEDQVSWMEMCIDSQNDNLIWIDQACPKPWISDLPQHVRGRIEYSPQSSTWLRQAADVLKKGFFLFFDYGYTDEEYFQIKRPDGTARGYRAHQLVSDVLKTPGEQDLTAHVRWSPLIKTGESLGLKTEELIQQSRWLTRIVAKNKLYLSPHEVRAFQTLTHPEILGEAFRVLIFTKI